MADLAVDAPGGLRQLNRCIDCRALISRGSRCRRHQLTRERTRKAGRGGSGWAASRTRQAILTRDGHRCRGCGGASSPHLLHVDHITPVSRGGANTDANLQTLCVDCHDTKTAREAAARA